MRPLQLVLLGLGCVLGDPDVFQNYFDDELRFVDVSQEVVLKACLPNGDDTVKKIQKAYDECFGQDYSFNDLADTVGRDSDNDDLPDEYEGNEACFYTTMDWVKGKEVQPSVIEADMAGIPGFERFKDDINSCSAWSGNFGGRKKRAIGDAQEDNEEEVPNIMESGSEALQWVKSLVRRARSAEPAEIKKVKNDKKGKKKKGKNARKKGKKKNNNKEEQNKNARYGRKGKKGRSIKIGKDGGTQRKGRKGGKKGKNNNKKEGKRKKKDRKNKNRKNKNKNKKNRNKKNKNKKNKNKNKNNNKNNKRSGNSSDLLPDSVYNQLWCFDLAMEQALEKCVEDKLNG